MKRIDVKSVLIGFLMAIIFFMTTGQKSKNMGKIVVTEITLQDEYGNIKGGIEIDESGNGAFYLMDNYSKTNPYFFIGTGGELPGPTMEVHNTKTKHKALLLSVNRDKGEINTIFNNSRTNQQGLILSADQNGGQIYVLDKKGEFVWGATASHGAVEKP